LDCDNADCGFWNGGHGWGGTWWGGGVKTKSKRHNRSDNRIQKCQSTYLPGVNQRKEKVNPTDGHEKAIAQLPTGK
jgi:hypothetical protein